MRVSGQRFGSVPSPFQDILSVAHRVTGQFWLGVIPLRVAGTTQPTDLQRFGVITVRGLDHSRLATCSTGRRAHQDAPLDCSVNRLVDAPEQASQLRVGLLPRASVPRSVCQQALTVSFVVGSSPLCEQSRIGLTARFGESRLMVPGGMQVGAIVFPDVLLIRLRPRFVIGRAARFAASAQPITSTGAAKKLSHRLRLAALRTHLRDGRRGIIQRHRMLLTSGARSRIVVSGPGLRRVNCTPVGVSVA